MKNSLRSAASLALVTMMLALSVLTLPHLSTSASAIAQGNAQSRGANAKDNSVKVSTGDTVKQRVQQLRLTDKALNRALKDMEKMGKLPNWEASAVIKQLQAPKKVEVASLNFVPASFKLQDSQSWNDSSGNEMIIITAYGDDSYWDGTINTYDASTGQRDTYNGSVDDLTAGDPDSSDVVDELYYPPDGGDPIREGGSGGCTREYACFQTEVMAANTSDTGKASMTKASLTSAARPVGFVGWFKRYFRCIKRCMALATQFCFHQYPNSFRRFFYCLAIGGTAASITCAFNTSACQ